MANGAPRKYDTRRTTARNAIRYILSHCKGTQGQKARTVGLSKQLVSKHSKDGGTANANTLCRVAEGAGMKIGILKYVRTTDNGDQYYIVSLIDSDK